MTRSDTAYWRPSALAAEVGLEHWQIKKAETAGLLPQPAHTRGWLPEQLPQVREAVPTIIERFGTEHPVGAPRCAERLARRLEREVLASDIEALSEAGHLHVVDVFTARGRAYDLFSPDAIDQLPADTVAETITAREQWRAASVSTDEACARLGWSRAELQQITEERALPVGRFGRYERATIDTLADDEELCARVEADRLVTGDQAAERLDVARRHFDIAAEHAWIAPQRHHEKQVGRYRTVDVPLYRTGDVDELLARPGIDWESVRATGKGERSPLLEHVGGRAPSRAAVVRAFLREFGGQHHIEMWGWWVPGPDVWEIDWERLDAGPTAGDVAAAIDDTPVLAQHRDVIQLSSHAGAAIRFARAMLEPDTAVILDTETTDLHGAVCELAVIDACTGATLLDTLVNPGVPIADGAYAVHGITESEVTADGVPDWPTVYRRLLRVTRNRAILSYNAVYDRGVITADCARHGIRRTRLAEVQHWADVMLPRSDHAHSRRWLPNGGGHRALGDVQRTRQHLLRMTAP